MSEEGRSGRARDASKVLPFVGAFLLMPPLVGLFAGPREIGGIPMLAAYVFGVWLALVVCAALLARRLR